MNVKELKKLLENVPETASVMIPQTMEDSLEVLMAEFDGESFLIYVQEKS